LGVILWDWDVAAIVMLFWSENLIIGALTLIKILFGSPILGWFGAAFFLLHYGAFCAVHGMFAAMLLGIDIGDPLAGGDWPFLLVFVQLLVGVIRGVVQTAPPEWIFGFAAVALSHGVSLVVHYFGGREYERYDTRHLMMAPYKRIVVLHLSILFGAFLAAWLASPMPLLVLLVTGKTLLDLRAHLKEHALGWRSMLAQRPMLAA
jgi:hypothetical protein